MRQRYFLGYSLIIFFCGALLVFVLNRVVSRNAERLTSSEQALYARQAAEGIEAFFDNCRNSLDFLAKRDEIINFGYDGRNTFKDFYETHQHEISGITRLDKDANIVYTYPYIESVIGKNVAHQAHNAEIIKTHKPVISDVFMLVQGFRALAYAYPVFNKEGQFDGMVSLLIPFDYTATRYLKQIEANENYTAYILSKEGIILFSGDTTLRGSDYRQWFKDSANLAVFEEMVAGEIGSLHYVEKSDSADTDKLAVYFPIRLETTFWSIGIESFIDRISGLDWRHKSLFVAIVLVTFGFIIFFNVLYFNSRQAHSKKMDETVTKFKVLSENTGTLLYEYMIDAGSLEFVGKSEQLVGYSPEELTKGGEKFFRDKIHHDDLESYLGYLDAAAENKNIINAEFRFRHKNGNYVFLENNATIVNVNGERLFYGALKDITKRKVSQAELRAHKNELEKLVKLRTKSLSDLNKTLEKDIKRREKLEQELIKAKEKAEKSEQLKSEFLAQVSHEIRTPINSILNFASLIILDAEEYLSTETKEGVNIINSAVNRLLRTIDLLINMSELETDNYHSKPQLYDLESEVLLQLIAELEPFAKAKKLKIKYSALSGGLSFVFDRYTVQQIFTNLIDNAIKYTEEGEINVIVSKEENKIICDVVDTGIGIKEEYIPDLFNKFTQEEQGYTRRYEGNGLGLALVKEYAQLNNAEVSIKSKKGVGSTFTVVFSDIKTTS